MSQLQLKIFQYVVKIILSCHLVLKILYDTNAASSVILEKLSCAYNEKKINIEFMDTL